MREALDKNYPAAARIPSCRRLAIPAPTGHDSRSAGGRGNGHVAGSEAQKVEEALDKASLGELHARRRRNRRRDRRSGTHDARASWPTVLSLIGILFYLAFRFQFSFGVGAVVATIHDLLITLAFLAFFRYDMTLNVIAAILTMTGFSTNDTIVIFDRIRENLRSMRRDSMDHVINASINQTLSRTMITSGTALLTALALFFFGGEVLHGFAFTMVVGIITGTYSSVFIAAAIVSLWRGTAPDARRARTPRPPPARRRRSSRSANRSRRGRRAPRRSQLSSFNAQCLS